MIEIKFKIIKLAGGNENGNWKMEKMNVKKFKIHFDLVSKKFQFECII